jgi:hypothetical protein
MLTFASSEIRSDCLADPVLARTAFTSVTTSYAGKGVVRYAW